MKLSIITVTWNSELYIAKQLSSVLSCCQNIAFEQIVVDNDSSDRCVQLVKSQFPKVLVMENSSNCGFSAANNQAFQLARGEYVLFLNPDMQVTPGSLETMVKMLDIESKIGIIGCKLIDESGKVNTEAGPRRFPRVYEMLFLITKLHHLFPGLLNRYLMKNFDFNKQQEVDSVRGSFMLVRRSILDQLGWAFDPRYFIWFEDVDLCREVKKMGYSVVYTPQASVYDFVGKSFKGQDDVWKQRQFTLSMLRYFKKWEPWYKWMWIATFRPVGIFLSKLKIVLEQ